MVSEELEVDRDTKNDEDTVMDLYYSVNLYKRGGLLRSCI